MEVRPEARYGTAAGVLLRAAREASLLVVGAAGGSEDSRGRCARSAPKRCHRDTRRAA
ncbi:hypothetical protein [Streptomyces luteogriseus]|uniref:hypothetical protein n=1 Tax=Streptomyces luteogriseus TaxID=68233 RepID=UPI0037B9607B